MSGRSLARARPARLGVTLSATLARIAGGLGLALSMSGCAVAAEPAATPLPVPTMQTDTIAVTDLPGWENDPLDGVERALRRQCALTRPPAPWPTLCAQLPATSDLRQWIETHFVARALGQPPAQPDAGSSGTGLLTGYFEPLLHGSRERTGVHQTPVYGRPSDLIVGADGARLRRAADGSLSAYPARARIETHGLAQAPVLCWLDDPVDAFFLHIQGSGRVQLPDGRTLYLGFADHNGHRYHAIGRELIRRGELEPEAVTAQSIRAWLQAHPAQSREILHSNPRYIFFRELSARSGSAGPPGALGVALEPGRSVATDPAFIPAGALLYLDSSHPVNGAPLRRTVVAQDRGAAITGAVRVDLFWGSGDEAGELAGLTRQPLRLWLLWPREEALPEGFRRPGA